MKVAEVTTEDQLVVELLDYEHRASQVMAVDV